MLVHGYDKVVGKYRIRIDQDVVLLALPAFELYELLDIRTVVTAQEAPALCNLLLAELCRRRGYPGRIELQLYCQPSDLDLSDANILQRPEVCFLS